ELGGVALDARLTGAAGECAHRVGDPPRVEDAGEAALQAGGAVGGELRIDDDGAFEAGGLPESGDVVGSAVPDGDDPRAGGFDLGDAGAQLRQVLAAEHSPKMPEEDEHRWMVAPEVAEALRGAVLGLDLGVR